MIDKLSLFSNVAVTNNPMENRIVITGDVIQSRSHGAHEWMPLLEHAITKYTGTFDIFRGDSFQAEVTADQVFESLFYLKSSLRQLEHMDVRIGIGVGNITFRGDDIKKSSGTAFIRSGEALDMLQKESLALRSDWSKLDERVNLILTLSTRLTDQWTPNVAQTVQAAMDHPKASQTQLSKIIGRTHQSQVSTELRRGHFSKILEVINYCTNDLLRYVK